MAVRYNTDSKQRYLLTNLPIPLPLPISFISFILQIDFETLNLKSCGNRFVTSFDKCPEPNHGLVKLATPLRYHICCNERHHPFSMRYTRDATPGMSSECPLD